MGYALGTSTLSFVDHQDPNDFINGSTGSAAGDIYGDLMAEDNALKRFKISGTAAVGRRYFEEARTGPTSPPPPKRKIS